MTSILLCLCFLATLWAALLYAPTETTMGDTQRIFYFHVPAAINSFLSFFVVFVCSIQYIRTRKRKWDQLAVSAAEIGVIFCLIVLITGPLWAKPVWGVFWRWEPRLTSALIMFTIYAAYLMLREHGGNTSDIRPVAALIGIAAFVNVPLVYFSVDLWAPDQQLHPQRNVELDPKMSIALLISLLSHFFLLLNLLFVRVRLQQIKETLSDVRIRADSHIEGL